MSELVLTVRKKSGLSREVNAVIAIMARDITLLS